MRQFIKDISLWILMLILMFLAIMFMNSISRAETDCVKPYRKCMDQLLIQPYKVNFKPCNKIYEACKKANAGTDSKGT